jgi:hypothetical protein
MLDDQSDYVLKLRVGSRVPSSGVVGQVVESRNPAYAPGDFVRAMTMTRQKYLTIDPLKHLSVKKVDPSLGPLHMHIGTLGMTGFTAWVGMLQLGRPQPGETVVVSAAAGAVGSVAGQLARAVGARTVGVVGGAEKCGQIRELFGFDEAVDYKSGDLAAAVAAACPEGIDVYFENVGGEIQKVAFELMNDFGRVPMCGQVAQYSGAGSPPGPNLMAVVLKRLRLLGFLAGDHVQDLLKFEAGAMKLVRDGRLKPHATVVSGFENLHEAVNSLTSGRNVGQQIHQMADDPTDARATR